MFDNVDDDEAGAWGHMKEMCLLDTSLRCPICGDFLDTAVSFPECSHSFCSLCIRRSLEFREICPCCRSAYTAVDLKPNRLLDTVVSNFRSSRSKLLTAVKKSSESTPPREQSKRKSEPTSLRRSKRFRGRNVELNEDEDPDWDPESELREDPGEARVSPNLQKKSCNRGPRTSVGACKTSEDALPATVANDSRPVPESVIVSDDEQAAAAAPLPTTAPPTQPPIGKVFCPVCTIPIFEKYINQHVDLCLAREGGTAEPPRERSQFLKPSEPDGPPKMKRMPTLVYSLLYALQHNHLPHTQA
ncbi:hypothetical protein CYMTET_43846 [Cymbomonas tetramitiformis]|uniref:RING-type E3 ubiquitin transferase n=1 Tax=Cymbomonas tetramitiformis TaxID=36881 RepID=A0AAE0EZW6_9CHLO|nr:hypothetical protein CYMTET_43846 [Cymbomonas tetramitiformis]